MKKILFSILFLFPFIGIYAQDSFTLNGNISDFSNGETLGAVNILVKELPDVGTSSNVYGFYSLSLPKGNYTISYSYMGFETNKIAINLSENTKKNIELNPIASTLGTVVITSNAARKHVKSPVTVSTLSIKEIETVPVLFGEKDIMKTLQLLPGVKSAGEGSSGFYVRGGSADQNMILLDEAPVYNASHLMGFFSVFNSDALKNAKLYKGYIPPKFGGRLSSVLDVQMKDGNNKKLSVNGGIGLISSRLTIEAPIVKDKGSFIISGRRTYADLFLKLSKKESLKDNKLYFYDFNVKGNYKIDDNNRIYVSGYFGRDVLGFKNAFGFDWGNITGTLRYNHIFSDKLFSNTTFVYSDFDYNIDIGLGDANIVIAAAIQDLNFKQDFSYYLNEKNKIRFGVNTIKHVFKPGSLESTIEGLNNSQLENKHALESAAYVSNKHKITPNITMSYGLRYSNFTQFGPGKIYDYNVYGEIESEKEYADNEVVVSYHGLAPRAALAFILNDKSSIKTSYNKTFQYLHLMSNSNGDNPTDVWLPSSNNIKPQESQQVVLGYFRNFGKEENYQFSVETYFKKMKNTVDYRTGAELTLNPTVEGELLYGKGRAYGLELLFKKSTGKFTGWLSYTLAKTEKQFEDINDNSWFPAKQDRTHDVSIVGSYKLTPRATLSANWVYYTGNAVTFPTAIYEIDGNYYNYYTDRNAGRMPDYHRLDIGFTLKNKKYKTNIDVLSGEEKQVKKAFESSWNFSVYNAYARENAYSIDFEESASDSNRNVAVQTALFKIVPSISYNFSF